MKKAQFWSIENVRRFRGYDVNGSEVEMADSEYEEWLTDIYGQVQVCGQMFDAGSLFVDADPVAFRCGKGELEDRIQSELEEQLKNEDDDEIEFYDDECDDEEDEE